MPGHLWSTAGPPSSKVLNPQNAHIRPLMSWWLIWGWSFPSFTCSCIGCSTLPMIPEGIKQLSHYLKCGYIFDEVLEGVWKRCSSIHCRSENNRQLGSQGWGCSRRSVRAPKMSPQHTSGSVCIHSISTTVSHRDFYAKRQGEGSGWPKQQMHIWMSEAWSIEPWESYQSEPQPAKLWFY